MHNAGRRISLPTQIGEPAYARTEPLACAGCCWRANGQRAEAIRGIRYLQDHKAPGQRGPIYPFYGLYYASHAMYLTDPHEWQAWYPPIRDELVASQQVDGHWDGEAGPIYGTELAILTLSVPMHYLPVYQHKSTTGHFYDLHDAFLHPAMIEPGETRLRPLFEFTCEFRR